MKSTVFAILVAIVLVVNGRYSEWEYWKKEHSRTYSRDEEERRREIWEDNKKFVEDRNYNNSFQLELNRFADLTNEEFSIIYLITEDISVTYREDYINVSITDLEYRDFPDYLDWREDGVVTPVKDQGSCGSCYAFSATGALEGQYKLRYGQLLSFSEQQAVDCSGGYGNWDCSGGWMSNVFSYWERYGAESSEEYPYTGQLGTCVYSLSAISARVLWHTRVWARERDLMSALVTLGPISIALDASSLQFHLYSTGVYTDTACSRRRFSHAMLAVGYGSRDGTAYWLVKNSWGEEWGEQGYMRIARGDNTCGVLSRASYPAVYR